MTIASTTTSSVSGQHAAKSGIHANPLGTGGLDSLFVDELDAAALARLSLDTTTTGDQSAVTNDKSPLKDAKGAKDPLLDSSLIVNSVDLTDAMQLAAAQMSTGSVQPVPIDTKATGSALNIDPLAGGIDTNSLGVNQLGPQLSNLNGVANQNLLNALTNATNSAPKTVDFQPQMVQKAPVITIQANQVANGGLVTGLPQNSQNLQQLATTLMVKTAPTTAVNIATNTAPEPKVESLSDAISKIDTVKVSLVQQGLDMKEINQAFALATKTEQPTPSSVTSGVTGDSTGVSINKADQSTKTASEDTSSVDPDQNTTQTAAALNGFMVNPSFTNHSATTTNLKLDAVNTSLAAGPLHAEVMTAAKSGGGRISLEVHPDNAGPVKIDLQIYQNGQARLVVQGASESTQARLQQGSDQLRQEFAQMGLNLSLDMGQNSSNNPSNQANTQMNSTFNNNGSQQFDTNDKNSNRMSNIQATSNTISDETSVTSGIRLVA